MVDISDKIPDETRQSGVNEVKWDAHVEIKHCAAHLKA